MCLDTSTSTIIVDLSAYEEPVVYSYDLSSKDALTIEFADLFSSSLELCGEIDFTVTSTVVTYDSLAKNLVVDSSDQDLAGTSEVVTITPYLRNYDTITGDSIDITVEFFTVQQYFISLNELPDFVSEVTTEYTVDLATKVVQKSANATESVSYSGT